MTSFTPQPHSRKRRAKTRPTSLELLFSLKAASPNPSLELKSGVARQNEVKLFVRTFHYFAGHTRVQYKEQLVILYCFTDDFLQQQKHHGQWRKSNNCPKFTDAEVIARALPPHSNAPTSWCAPMTLGPFPTCVRTNSG